jgi:hypothetical protein
LRKYLIAAIAALASIALASVAVAQGGQSGEDITATTKLTPTKAGTKKKPKAARLSFFAKNNVPNTTASTIEIDFPSTVKVSGKGLTKCDIAVFGQPGGKANCPAKSKAGTGVSHAVTGPQRTPLNFNVTAYVGGNNLIVFYIEQQAPGTIRRALPGKISPASGKFKQKLVIGIPEDLQSPAPGLYGSLLDLRSTLSNKKGKKSLISTVGCKKKKHTFGTKLTFVPNPNPPAKSTATGTSTSKCSK